MVIREGAASTTVSRQNLGEATIDSRRRCLLGKDAKRSLDSIQGSTANNYLT